METSNNLEIKGSLQTNPLAELLSEIAQNQFNGSLRLSNDTQKTVVYFDAGNVIFAVSNVRQHRLFQMLLQAGKINQEGLLAIKEFTNDLVLKDHLLKNNLFTEAQINQILEQQVYDVLQAAINWETGEWIFSPLVRVKNDLRFEIDLRKASFEFARSLSAEQTTQKIKNFGESFTPVSPMPTGINISPHEWFVYSRFENSTLNRDEIQNLSGLSASETAQIIYVLWLGGFLTRSDYHAAFSERYVAAIVSARLALKKEDPKPAVVIEPKIETPTEETTPIEETKAEETSQPQQISLEEYLIRVENSVNYYEFLGLPADIISTEIKKTYFSLAKRFHPDLYRREQNVELKHRIEAAFTKLAQAYDTLKDASSREVYDFKMRKEIAEMVERQKSGETIEEVDTRKQVDQAGENFDQGFNYLMDDDYEAAVPYLARAVFYSKNNARYHAYYGKALSADENQSHRAEAELQTAIKLDNQNPDYRIMLAELFIDIGLVKRAEGELKRLLAITPNHHEARMMLDRLKRK